MKFTDGMDINTEGPYRKLRKSDGWYVVGQGSLEYATDEAEADEILTGIRDRCAHNQVIGQPGMSCYCVFCGKILSSRVEA